VFLSILISLACFTTAVSVIVGTADFFKGLFKDSQTVYVITAIIACTLGVLVGQFDVQYIIRIALPVLMFIYPLTIVLIILNAIPEKFASKQVFRIVVLITFIFSIPDFLSFVLPHGSLDAMIKTIPLSKENLGWLLPALTAFVLINIFQKKQN